jgi:hypothetical protein
MLFAAPMAAHQVSLAMARDGRTEAIFTTADDQMQALWGLHRYLKAAVESAEPESVIEKLPPHYIMTHEWVRHYEPREMATALNPLWEFLLCRQSLVALVTICETALHRFSERLEKVKKLKKAPPAKNVGLLTWAFEVVKNARLASPKAIARLPETCGDLDNARRLRNCIVHRNGCYSQKTYFGHVIQDGWIKPQYERDSTSAAAKREPIFLLTSRFEYFTRSHLEFLHVLHTTIQDVYFGHSIPYNYAAEGKRAEWHRLLSGRRDVDM